MEPLTLKTFLQLHLSTDAHATTHLAFVLQSLTAQALAAPSYIPKWTARITSLINSREPGARWSGLCLAAETAKHSRDVMVECVQGWLALVLLILPKNEPVPTLKAAIRFLRYIYTSTIDLAEFQRQLVTPNVPKVVPILLSIIANHEDESLKIICLESLAHFVTTFPSLCRPFHNHLQTSCTRTLNSRQVTAATVQAASSLYSVLHLVGGKVNGSGQWRKNVEETLAICWSAFSGVRTSFQHPGIHCTNLPTEDPLVSVPRSLQQLDTGVTILIQLLRTVTARPVQIPTGAMSQLCVALLQCYPGEPAKELVDASVRALELAAIPTLWRLGCFLLRQLASCAHRHLSPHAHNLMALLAYQLEQPLPASHRIHFLETVPILLRYSMHNERVPTRMAKAILPSLANLLISRADAIQNDQASKFAKKGKKRARGYEGDELFKGQRQVICATAVESAIAIASVKALSALLQCARLTSTMSSLSARMLLSLYLSLPLTDPASLSLDLSLHARLQGLVVEACTHIVVGTTNMLSKSLGLTLRKTHRDAAEWAQESSAMAERTLEMLLHPRVPPLIRPLPHVESLVMYRGEEGEEEVAARKALGLSTFEPPPSVQEQGIPQKEHSPLPVFRQPGRASQTNLGSAQMAASRVSSNPTAPAIPTPLDPAIPSTGASTANHAPPSPAPVTTSALTDESVTTSQTQILQPIPSKPITVLQPDLGSTSATQHFESGSIFSTAPVEPDIDLDVLMDGVGEEDEEEEAIPTIDLASDTESEYEPRS